MDCKDLTICDYVKHNGVIKVVDAVYLYSVSVHDPSEEWSISEAKTYPVDDIEPIKLTEEILVKNGFYRSPRWHYCEITIGNFLIHVQLGCGGKIDYVDITSKLSNALARKEIDMTTHINYVHQLQHLLRLCRIEKELTI